MSNDESIFFIFIAMKVKVKQENHSSTCFCGVSWWIVRKWQNSSGETV